MGSRATKMRLLAATGMCIVSSAALAQDYGLQSTDSTPINNPSGTTLQGAKTGILSTGSQLNLDNAGTIRGDGTAVTGRIADAGILVTGGPAAITNSGSITGAGFGITTGIFSDPDTNAPSGRAIGSTIINSGTIIGDNNDGIRLMGGGTVTNSGYIAGRVGAGADGISMFSFFDQDLNNFTTIGSVDNLASGVIEGNRFGVILSNGGVVNNAGTISGNSGSILMQAGAVGVEPPRNGTVNNSGTLNGTVQFNNLANASVTNSGTITSPNGAGVFATAPGGSLSIDNQASGAITGATKGIESDGSSLSVTNAGVIRGDGTAGGSISADGGIVISGGPANITNSGDISGARFGITTLYFTNPDNSIEGRAIGSVITNSGTIIGDNGSGVRLFGGGSVTNSGDIEGRVGAAADGITMLAFNGQDLTGQTGIGTVDNLAGGTILGARYGVNLFGGGTIHNAGRISSTIIQGTQGSERIWSGDMTNSGVVDGVANFFALKSASLDNSGTIGGTAGFSQITDATMTNSGTVEAFTYFNYVDHASLTNSGFLNDFVQFNIGDGSLTNSGSIVTGVNASFYGIGGAVFSNGNFVVDNQATGTIVGNTSGIDHLGPSLTVNNAGIIRGDGTVSSLTVPNAGIVFSGGPANITNSGTISGAKFGIASALYTDPITNQVSGRAIGSVIDNSGSIIGDNGHGIRLIGGGSVTNSGYIAGRSAGGPVADGISMFPSNDQAAANSIGTVTNLAGGTIEGNRVGVLLSGGGSISNAGTIQGNLAGVAIQSGNFAGRIGTLANSGTIGGGAEFIGLDSGTLTNSSTGIINGGSAGAISIDGGVPAAVASVSNAGTVAGSVAFFELSSANLSNSGSIVGGGTSATPDGSAIYSDSALTIGNSGTIQGDHGVGLSFDGGGSLANTGSITSNTVQAITASKRVTLTNAGTISGTGGTAATLSDFNDDVVLQTGSNIIGTVNGAGGSDTLSLTGSVSSPSSLQTIGNFLNFENLNVLSGYWTVPGNAGTFASTTLSGGALAVNGSITSPISVGGGAMLAGTGTIIGNTTMNSGGLLAPAGSSLGTLSIVGNVAFNTGSTFSVQTSPDGSSDKLAVTGAVTITKGTNIQVLAGIAHYAPTTSYVVLTATGGISGKFANVLTDYAYFKATVNTQQKGTITIQIAPNGKPLPSAASALAFSTASAVDALGLNSQLYQSVLYQSLTGARQAFNALSGSGYGRLDAIMNQDLGRLTFASAAANTDAPSLAWTNINALTARGAANGALRRRGAFSLFMVGGRYGTSLASNEVSGDVDTRFLAGAVAYHSGRFSGLAGITSAWHDAAITRTIIYPGFAERSQARYRSTTSRLELEGDYDLAHGSGINATPYLGYAHLIIAAPAFSESGGFSAVAFGRENRAIDQVRLGLRMAGRFEIGGLNLSPHVDASAQRFWGTGDPARTGRFVGGETSFDSGAQTFNRTEASVDGGIDVAIGRATVSASYLIRRGDRWSDQTGRLTAALHF